MNKNGVNSPKSKRLLRKLLVGQKYSHLCLYDDPDCDTCNKFLKNEKNISIYNDTFILKVVIIFASKNDLLLGYYLLFQFNRVTKSKNDYHSF